MNGRGNKVFARHRFPVQKASKQGYINSYRRPCSHRSIVSCSETPRATFHLLSSRWALPRSVASTQPPQTPSMVSAKRSFIMGCLRRLLFGSPASRSGCGALPVFEHPPKKVPASFRNSIQQALKHYFHSTIRANKSELIFCLHYIPSKKRPHLSKTLSLWFKNFQHPLCSRNRGRQLSASHPFLAPPFAPLADRLACFE